MRLCFFVYLHEHRTLHVGYIHLYLLRERKKVLYYYYVGVHPYEVCSIFYISPKHLHLKVKNIRFLLLLQKHHLVLLWILKTLGAVNKEIIL